MRVVNWHRFADETARFAGSTLLFGDTGSGKTTLLDAVQYVLVADQHTVLFNRSANPQSKRTLVGYVCGKIGSENDGDVRKARFLRPQSVSFAMVGFQDQLDPSRSFVAGVCFEANAEATRVEKLFFVVPEADVDAIPALDANRCPRPAEAFRKTIQPKGQSARATITREVHHYQATLRQRLGPLAAGPGSEVAPFHRLVVRALEFKPVANVHDFVTSFLADPDPVSTEDLLANLENYQALEREALQGRERRDELLQVLETSKRLEERKALHEQAAFVHRYAGTERLRAELEDQEVILSELDGFIASCSVRVARLTETLADLEKERDAVLTSLGRIDEERQRLELERSEQAIVDELLEAKQASEAIERILERQRVALSSWSDERLTAARGELESLFKWDSVLAKVHQVPALPTRETCALIQSRGRLEEEHRKRWEQIVQDVLLDASRLSEHAKRRSRDLEDEARALQEEQRSLHAGRVSYDEALLALLFQIESRLTVRRSVRPLCELVDVHDERWRFPLEHLLGANRFALVADPQDYEHIVRLYRELKDDCPAPSGRRLRLIGVAVINTGRIPHVTLPPNAVGAEITTNDPLARRACDFYLRDVLKAETPEEASRAPKRAITPDGFVYAQFTLRREDLRRHRPALGRGAVESRRREIAERLSTLEHDHRSAGQVADAVLAASSASFEALKELNLLPELYRRTDRTAIVEDKLRRVRRAIEGLDMSSTTPLRTRLDALDIDRQEHRSALEGAKEARAKAKGQREEVEKSRDSRKSAWQESLSEIERVFPGAVTHERWANYRSLYQAALAHGRKANTIQKQFGETAEALQGEVETLRGDLRELKMQFGNKWGPTATESPDDILPFAQQYNDLVASRLPDYEVRIAQARHRAQQQIIDDVLAKLGERFRKLKRMFRELNDTLGDFQFGRDTYAFLLSPSPQRKRFYDLVEQAGELRRDRESLSVSLEQSPTLKQALDDLLNQLTSAKQLIGQLEDLSDYREYFRYDLEIRRADNTRLSWAHDGAEGSGGETQTPFYIAIFASFHRMYRAAEPTRPPKAGLVLLDEAFSKMDPHRVKETMRLANRMELQLVIATPKDRAALLAPLVKTCIYVHQGPSGHVALFDYTSKLHDWAEETASSPEARTKSAAKQS